MRVRGSERAKRYSMENLEKLSEVDIRLVRARLGVGAPGIRYCTDLAACVPVEAH